MITLTSRLPLRTHRIPPNEPYEDSKDSEDSEDSEHPKNPTNKMSRTAGFKGHLSINVMELRKLPACDPYVVITAGGTKVKTEHKNNCENDARIDQEITLRLDGSEDDLEIIVMDYDRWTSDDVVATTGRKPLEEVMDQWITGSDVWLNLKSKDGDGIIKVHVKIDFVPQ